MREPTDGVVRGQTRVGVRRDVGRLHARRQPEQRALLDADVLREPSVNGEARELVAVAMHVVPAPARHAKPAAPGRIHEHRVALGDRRHTRPNLLDPACVLVAKHERQGDPGRLHQPLDRVEVGGADPRAADADENVRRMRRLGHGPIDELERLVVLAHQCSFHVASLSRLRHLDPNNRAAGRESPWEACNRFPASVFALHTSVSL